MSWAKEEWKQDLPSKALQKIHNLENELENMRKSKQQQDLKIDGYVSTLEKQKKEFTDEKALNAVMQRDVHDLTKQLTNREVKQEKLLVELNAKVKKLELGDEALQKVRQKLKTENAKSVELQKSLGQKQSEAENYAERSETLAVEVEKLKQEKVNMSKENEGSSEKVKVLTKEIENLRKKAAKQDENIIQQVEENEKEEYRPPTEMKEREVKEASSDAFMEIMKKENNALINENEDLKIQRDQLKHIVEEKVNEIERNMAKAAIIKMELQNTQRAHRESEEKVEMLESTLENRESKIKDLEGQVEELEREKKKIKEELVCVNFNTEAAKESKSCVVKELEEGLKKLKYIEVELNKTKNNLKDKQEQIEMLEIQNQEFLTDIRGLKEQVKNLREASNSVTKELKKKEQRLKALNEEQQSNEKKEKRRLEKLEVLLLENANMRRDLEELERESRDAKAEYESITQALESSRKVVQTLEVKLTRNDNEDGNGEDSKMETREVEMADTGTQWQDVTTDKENEFSLCDECADTRVYAATQTQIQGDFIRHMQVQIHELEEDKATLAETALEQDQIVEDLITQIENARKTNERNHGGESSSIKKVEMVDMERLEVNDHKEVADGSVAEKLSTCEEGPKGDDNHLEEMSTDKNWFNCLEDLKKEHEILKIGVQECCNTAKTVEGISVKEIAGKKANCGHDFEELFQNVRYLLNQLVAVKIVILRCEEKIGSQSALKNKAETLPESMQEQLEGMPKSQDIRESESEVDLASRTPKKDLSWDNFEADRAFQDFKHEVDSLVGQIDSEKQSADTQSGELQELKQVLKELDRKDEGRMRKQSCINVSQLADAMSILFAENNDVIDRRMEEHFKHIETTLQSRLPLKKHCKQKCKGDSDGNHDSEGESSFETRCVLDGKYAVEELEMMKRKLQEIQTSIKQLLSTAAMAEKERTEAHSHLDLLANEMKEKEIHFESRCGELENVVKTGSQQEIALRRQLNNMRTEKEDINCDLREILESLKEKELELVKNTQEMKHMQSKNLETEEKYKNKIAALQRENEAVWQDYTEASKNAELKEIEFKGLFEHLKSSEGSLMNLFNTLGNIDDLLQKAREMQSYE